MKRLRRIIFWCHLPVGVIGGLVIFNMCVTGVLLTYEKQITSWADTRNYRSAPPAPGAQHLPVETLIAKSRESRGGNPTAITVKSDPSAPAEIAFGRETTLFVNPYTGSIYGEGSQRVRNFFRGVTEWHRWLGAKGENRNVARAITGACNLGFLFLVMSGFYLWWPRNWNLKSLRNVTWFRRGLPSKARYFNWHNVIGFWSAVPLFIVVLSAVMISYTWAGNLVYRIAGETTCLGSYERRRGSLGTVFVLHPWPPASFNPAFCPHGRGCGNCWTNDCGSCLSRGRDACFHRTRTCDSAFPRLGGKPIAIFESSV
jgi:uncharacterized iron-regulated membrane protein